MRGTSFLPLLVLAGCLFFGLPFCISCDGSNHQFLLNFCLIVCITYYIFIFIFLNDISFLDKKTSHKIKCMSFILHGPLIVELEQQLLLVARNKRMFSSLDSC
jgi:hypothetical protein